MFRNHIMLFFLLSMTLPGFGQTRVHNKELAGTWQFDQLVDANDNKIDTIYHNIGWEIPKGPTITFNEDGSYLKVFGPNAVDKGTWFYEGDKNTITYHPYLDKNKDTYQYIIGSGVAKKDEKGNYYQQITDSVVSFSETRLVLFQDPDKKWIYKKK